MPAVGGNFGNPLRIQIGGLPVIAHPNKILVSSPLYNFPTFFSKCTPLVPFEMFAHYACNYMLITKSRKPKPAKRCLSMKLSLVWESASFIWPGVVRSH